MHTANHEIKLVRDILSDDAMKRIEEIQSKPDYKIDDVCDVILQEGERFFEQMVAPYPFFVERRLPEYMPEMFEFLEECQNWLAENFSGDSYIPFPTDAIGVHREKCHGVYFKNASDAIMFKLRWVGTNV